MNKVAQKKVGKGLKRTSSRVRAPKASTIRLKPELQSALDAISCHLDRPKNKIVNQAVAEFLEKTTFRMRDDIEGTLQNLRAYRSKDPGFKADIERFAEAESAYAGEDTHEGKVQSSSSQPLTHEIEELIHA
jgi:predicted transcriptional regulator